MSQVVRPLYNEFFGPNAYLMESFSSDGVQQHKMYGRTIHEANDLQMYDPLNTANLQLNPATRAKMVRLVAPLAGLGIDNIGEVSGELLHANSVRFTYAREVLHTCQGYHRHPPFSQAMRDWCRRTPGEIGVGERYAGRTLDEAGANRWADAREVEWACQSMNHERYHRHPPFSQTMKDWCGRTLDEGGIPPSHLPDFGQTCLFGGLPFMLCGDFLSLQPESSLSLILGLQGKSPEHKAGDAILAGIAHVFNFQQMKRFTDPLLVEFLAGMRKPGGQKVAPAARQAIEASRLRPGTAHDGTNNGASQPADDVLRDTVMFRETAYHKKILAFASQARTKAQAAAQQKIIFYLQAVDRPASPVYPSAYHTMLNETNTSNLTGLLPLFVQQDVILTKTWLKPFYITGTQGKVVGFQPHADEAPIFEASSGDCQRTSIWTDGVVILRFQPQAVLVRIKDSTDEFLEPTPCHHHRSRANRACPNCNFHVGIIAVEPVTATWQWHDKKHADGWISDRYPWMSVRRTQIPLAPLCATTLHQLQGATMHPGLVAHLNLPPYLSKRAKWMAQYTMFSRPRAFSTLRTHGEPDWELIEGGPPEEIITALDGLFKDKIQKTRDTCREARAALNWPDNPESYPSHEARF